MAADTTNALKFDIFVNSQQFAQKGPSEGVLWIFGVIRTMQELFFTILIVWILFRVLNSSSSPRSGVFFTQNNFHQRERSGEQGKTDVTYVPKEEKKKSDDIGEYVDFEEMK